MSSAPYSLKWLLLASQVIARTALASPPEGTVAEPSPQNASSQAVGLAPAAAPPPPYSLPFQLRPAMPLSAARLDSTFAVWRDTAGGGGTTNITSALFSYKVTPRLSPLLRLGFVGNAPRSTSGGMSFLNPVVGATYGFSPGPSWRVALFFGTALPVGTGSGPSPQRVANGAGVLGRSAMDNAMFAVNYLTLFPGVSVAWVANKLTVQAEATVLQLLRVRGADVDRDAARTNFTSGLHLGYFILPRLSVGTELRYQRWLVNPSLGPNSLAKDTLSVAVGPRVHIPLGGTVWSRAALVYARGITGPMATANYHVVQLDLAFPF